MKRPFGGLASNTFFTPNLMRPVRYLIAGMAILVCSGCSWRFFTVPDCCSEAKISSEFTYQGQPIHPGCIRELDVALDGDDVVSEINLGRTPDRGCATSNKYFSDVEVTEDGYFQIRLPGPTDNYRYKPIAFLEDNLHLLETLEITGNTSRRAKLLVLVITNCQVRVQENSADLAFEKVAIDQLRLVGRLPATTPTRQSDLDLLRRSANRLRTVRASRYVGC